MRLPVFFSALKEYLKFKAHGFLKTKIHTSRQSELEKKLKFYGSFLSKGQLCFDIGANLGNRTEVFISLGCPVIAVEPQTFCYHYLKLRFKNKITILKKGASNHEGIAELFISDSSTLSSISTEWIDKVKKTRFNSFSWHQKEKISLTTLDNLIEDYGIPFFIKIDVEGYELQVLKGLHSIVPMIAFEYTTPECTEALLSCIQTIDLLSSEYRYNFSKGEHNKFHLESWLSFADFKKLIVENIEVLEGFGDVYAKHSKGNENTSKNL